LDSDWSVHATETWHEMWKKYDYVLVRPDFYVVSAWRHGNEQTNIVENIKKSFNRSLNLSLEMLE